MYSSLKNVIYNLDNFEIRLHGVYKIYRCDKRISSLFIKHFKKAVDYFIFCFFFLFNLYKTKRKRKIFSYLYRLENKYI